MKAVLICTLAGSLAGGAALAERVASGKAMAGDIAVSWTEMNSKVSRSAGVAKPASLVLFAFEAKIKGAAVSEDTRAAEAARHGVDVATLKIMLGRSVYVNKAGHLASCTMSAIEKGYCGTYNSLTVESRAKIARSILEKSGKCRWTGFDENLHNRLAQQNGAASATLWVAADCR